MSKIIQFPSSKTTSDIQKIIQAEEKFTKEAYDVSVWMEEVPSNVQRILSTKPNELLQLNFPDLWQFLFYEIFERVESLRSKNDNYLNFLLAIRYFTDLLSETFFQKNIDWYVGDHLFGSAQKRIDSSGALKSPERAAGDTAVFGYLFLHKKRNNLLTHTDYFHMAQGSYYAWSKSQVEHIGYIVAEHVTLILPPIQDFSVDMMKRVENMKDRF